MVKSKKRFDGYWPQTVPCLGTNTHAGTNNVWSQGCFGSVAVMLKFMVVRTVDLPHHSCRKLYSSIFLCMLCTYLNVQNLIISSVCKGNFYQQWPPILFSKVTSVFQNFCNFSNQLQQQALSLFWIKSTIKLLNSIFSAVFNKILLQLVDSRNSTNIQQIQQEIQQTFIWILLQKHICTKAYKTLWYFILTFCPAITSVY